MRRVRDNSITEIFKEYIDVNAHIKFKYFEIYEESINEYFHIFYIHD
jgi:hypothetical protein